MEAEGEQVDTSEGEKRERGVGLVEVVFRMP